MITKTSAQKNCTWCSAEFKTGEAVTIVNVDRKPINGSDMRIIKTGVWFHTDCAHKFEKSNKQLKCFGDDKWVVE